MVPPTTPLADARPRPHTTVSGWLQAVATGEDPAPALDAALAQARAAADLHVWIHLCPPAAWAAQQARLAARLAEPGDRRSLLARYPLLGVPFAVKDNINIGGEPTTAACPSFARVAKKSATVVQRLLDAGAIWLGKSNLDQFATGLVGTRSPYGRPACVVDPTRISGGSSSGSAVAVARGLVAFALGTDTAGSGRVPAAFNGLVGLKPTPGRVSTAGVLPACRTLDCVSVFAHSVDDASLVLALIEGPDPADPYSAGVTGPACLPAALRVGVPRDPPWMGDVGYPAAWAAARAHSSALGHRLVDVDFAPMAAVAALLYDGPWVAERHAVVRELLATEPEAFDPTVRRVIERAVGLSATDAFEGLYTLRAAQAALAALWDEVDVLMVPTAPGHPRFAEVDADPLGVNTRLGTYTNFVNLLGWCALAVPAGKAGHGLPFGVTFIGRGGFDAALLHMARRWLGDTEPGPTAHRPASTPSLLLALVCERGQTSSETSGPSGPSSQQRRLRALGATCVETGRTGAGYRLFAPPGATPPHPALLRVVSGGAAIAVDLWALPMTAVGSFLAELPAPLGLGHIELEDGRSVHGVLCDPHAVADAFDITARGGRQADLAGPGCHLARLTLQRQAETPPRPTENVSMKHEAYVDAAAATLGLRIAAEHRKGVLMFFELAASMAVLVDGLPLTPADESGNVFTPVVPEVDA